MAVTATVSLGWASAESAAGGQPRPSPRIAQQSPRSFQYVPRTIDLQPRVIDVAPKRSGSQTTVGSDVLFAFDSSRLNPAAQQVLATVVQRVRSAPPGRVTVTGYTDSIGTKSYNLGLSRRRAAAVVGFLAAHAGRHGHTYQAVGKGKADPVATNANAAGRQQNRRVSVDIPR